MQLKFLLWRHALILKKRKWRRFRSTVFPIKWSTHEEMIHLVHRRSYYHLYPTSCGLSNPDSTLQWWLCSFQSRKSLKKQSINLLVRLSTFLSVLNSSCVVFSHIKADGDACHLGQVWQQIIRSCTTFLIAFKQQYQSGSYLNCGWPSWQLKQHMSVDLPMSSCKFHDFEYRWMKRDDSEHVWLLLMKLVYFSLLQWHLQKRKAWQLSQIKSQDRQHVHFTRH